MAGNFPFCASAAVKGGGGGMGFKESLAAARLPNLTMPPGSNRNPLTEPDRL